MAAAHYKVIQYRLCMHAVHACCTHDPRMLGGILGSCAYINLRCSHAIDIWSSCWF